MNKLKYNIAKRISSGYYYSDDTDDISYEQLLEAIYNNVYKTIYKVPINTFILGNIQSYKIKDLDHANRILTSLKEVVREALEWGGIELTYTDKDWDDLKLLANPTQWGGPYILSKNDESEGKLQGKSYMSEYFEI